MLSKYAVSILLLGLLVMVSAVSVVFSKHENRKAFVQLQDLQTDRDTMDIYWGKLQLEQGAWTTHGRVEQIAQTRLGMQSPGKVKIIIVQP